MFGEEWPIAAVPDDEDAAAADRPVDRAPPARGRRLATVLSDFFLGPADRLTEQERAVMTAMLHGLVVTTADEVRVRLPLQLTAASEYDGDELVAILSAAGPIRRAPLIRHLLARADAARIAQTIESGGAGGGLLQRWTADPDTEVAAAAMALVVARGRSRDRFGNPAVHIHDLDADTAVALVHGIAAALAWTSASNCDEAFADAADELLARHDEGHRPEAVAARLVRAFDSDGRLGSKTLVELTRDGDAQLLGHALGQLARIGFDDAWAMLTGEEGSPALLLRLAGQDRSTAATLIAILGDSLGIADPAAEIDRFDRLDPAELHREGRRLRLSLHYRGAKAALEAHGSVCR